MFRNHLLAMLMLCSVGCSNSNNDNSTNNVNNTNNQNDVGLSDLGSDASGGAALIESALDSSEGASIASALVATTAQPAAEALAGGTPPTTDEEIAQAVVDSITTPELLCPYGGTASATVTGTTVTYTFNNCSTHCGMHRTTGSVDVTYGLSNGAVSVTIEASDLQVDLTTTTIMASATYSLSGTTATYDVTSDSTTTGPFGNALDISGTYSVSFDVATVCIEQNGSLTWGLRTRPHTVTLENYARCALECPQAGSKLTYEGPRGYTASIEFTADDTVTWTGSGGGSGSVTLAFCGEE